MSHTKKTLEELDIMDDFLMNAVASNQEVGEAFCKKLLSVLLQKKIGKVRIVAQRALFPDKPNLRGIRMDVEVLKLKDEEDTASQAVMVSDPHGTNPLDGQHTKKEQGTKKERVTSVYDLEPHPRKNGSLPKRNRFYQAKIDSRYLPSGEEDFSRIPELYIISFTDYDPFDKDYMMYVIENRCVEIPELVYDDGLKFIYFYTKGIHGGCEVIKNVLKYMRNSNADNGVDEVTREIHNYVSKVKVDPEVKVDYMKFEEIIYYERQDAAKEADKQATLRTKMQDILELLEEYGVVTQEVRARLAEEKDEAVLKKWHKLAARVASIEEFVEKLDV